jgi:formiminotetrahydrofolate cyclodeaminase
MRTLSVQQFLERLASADPTPGGGSASAVAGAAAAALVGMVARLSARQGRDDAVLAQIAASADAERAALLELAQRDAEAFDAVIQAMRLPRGDPEERARRQEAIQRALREAADVPLEVARRCAGLLDLAAGLARTGAPAAASDVGVAVLLAYAAATGALFNVRINLASLRDPAYVAHTGEQVRALLQRAEVVRDEALAAVEQRLGPVPMPPVRPEEPSSPSGDPPTPDVRPAERE